MRSKSFPVRSRSHRASLISGDPYPSPASLPGETNERFASGVSTRECDSGDAANVEIVPDTFDERDVPSKKRRCVATSETSRGDSSLDACIVCDISDKRVSRCSGTGCLLSFHEECLNPDLGSSEYLAKTYCPYCWFKTLAMRHKSVKEKAVGAEEEVSKYLRKETKSKDRSVDRTVRDPVLRGEKGECSFEKEQLQVEKDSDKPREDMPLNEGTDYQPEEDTAKFQDAEEDKDEETTKDQTKVNTGAAGGKGDVSPFLSGKEQDQIQQNEKPRRRRRQLILSYVDSELSSDESTNELDGDDVIEHITSPAQVATYPSGTMKNEQRKHSAITKVAKSKSVRDIPSFKSDQRRRLFWTPEEEEMLRVGVEKFSAEAKKNMPWRKVLEMGQEVFHETRTPADLKDKWRNINGGSRKRTN